MSKDPPQFFSNQFVLFVVCPFQSSLYYTGAAIINYSAISRFGQYAIDCCRCRSHKSTKCESYIAEGLYGIDCAFAQPRENARVRSGTRNGCCRISPDCPISTYNRCNRLHARQSAIARRRIGKFLFVSLLCSSVVYDAVVHVSFF